MSKTQFMRIALIASSVLILIGVGLTGWLVATVDDTSVIRVALDEGETEALAFENLALVPGASCEYTIKLKKGAQEEYNLTLDFVETEDRNLKKFAHVQILSSGEVVCDELLEKVLDESETIVMPVNFKTNQNTELTVRYYLPLDVGNEAKNAEALFHLRLTASNE